MKKIHIILLVLLLTMSLFAGCSSSSGYDSYAEESYPAEAPMMEESAEYDGEYATNDGGGAVTGGAISDVPNRDIIKTANVEMETKEFDTATTSIISLVEQYGGIIESSELYSYDYDYGEEREMSLRIRVPSGDYSKFLQELGGFGNVLHISETSEDVTEQLVDYNARLETLRVQEQRLLEILAQAETVTEMIEIESSLAQVRYEIETIDAQRASVQGLVDMSTISLWLREVVVYTPTEVTFGEEIGLAFLSGTEFLFDAIEFAILAFFTLLPIAILFLIPAVIVLLIILIVKRKKRTK